MAKPPKRTPVPLFHEPGETPDDAVAERQLIERIRSKQGSGLVVRNPVPLSPHMEPQEGREVSSATLGSLLAGEGFQVDEEDLSEAIEETVRRETPDPAWEGLTKQMIRSNCAFFAQEVLTGPANPPYNGKYFISEHHEEWNELVCNHDRICVLAPRDHGKTFWFNFAYPLWKASTMPWGKGFILSATAPQAERILEDIIAEVEGNPELQWLIPSRKDSRKWSSKYVRFSNGHRIYARGFGTKVRGFHPDYIICDDVLNDETAYSELVRRKQTDYFYNAVTNMCVPGGQIIVVGCVTPDTWIATEFGLRKLGSVNPGDDTPEKYYDLDLGVTGRRTMQRTTKFWVQGEVPTKRVTLELGYRLEGSHRHPFLVMGEDGVADWRRADELMVGDYVAVKANTDSWGPDIPVCLEYNGQRSHNALKMPEVITPDLAYLVGLWTAKGSCEHSGRIMISNTEPEVRSWLAGRPFGLDFKPNDVPGSIQTMRASSKPFLDWLVSLGAKLGRAGDKVIPEKIMAAPKLIAREFLRGLFDGDGCAYAGGSSHQVVFATISESLARDTQVLLLNFGILASLRKRPPAKPTERAPNGGTAPLWLVVITGQDAVEYMRVIGFRIPRKQAVAADMRGDSGSQWRGIPYQAAHIGRARKQKPRRPRGTVATAPPVNITHAAQVRRPRRETLAKIVEWFEAHGSQGDGVEGLKANLAESDLVWLRVKDITAAHSMTMDFVIEGDHSFITNGIVSHNTPFHAKDLYGDLEENDEYEFRKYVAMSPGGEALWPERYSIDEDPPKGVASLPRKRREIGSIRFTREFLCEPVADDMSLFPMRLFKGDPVEQFNITLGMPAEFWDKAGVTRFMGVDFAMSSNVSADFTVVWTMGLDDFGNRWLIDIQRERGLAYQEQLSLINAVGRKYDPALIFLEENAMQRIFGDELIRTSDLPIRKFTTGVQKNTLDKGVPSLRVLLENGKFRIPRGDKRSVELTDIWIEEMRAITYQDGKIVSVGGHDDTVMACWICDQCIRHGGFKFSFGDEEYEGSLDDFMDELTGQVDGEANLVQAAGGEASEEARAAHVVMQPDDAKDSKDPKQLQGEALLRALVKRQFGGKKRKPPPTSGGNGNRKQPPPAPGLGDLVDEDKFW